MGGLDQGRRVTFSPLSPLFYSVLYRCKEKCNSMQNVPYLSWLGIQHAHGLTVWVPTLPFMLLPVPSHISKKKLACTCTYYALLAPVMTGKAFVRKFSVMSVSQSRSYSRLTANLFYDLCSLQKV